MNEAEINKFTLEGLKKSLPNMQITEQEFRGNNLEQSLNKGQYQVDAIYEFGKSAIDGKQGVNMFYTAKGEKEEQIKEIVSIFTDYLEYDVKGAIEEFSKLDLPLINYFFESSYNEDDLNYLESVYYNPFSDPEEIQGWKIIVGVQKKYINNEFEYLKPEESKDIFNAIYAGINNVLFKSPKKYFIKNWISRKGKKGMWADCRVNNEDWKIGQDLLFDYGQSWNIGDDKVSIKQNILLIPTSLNELEKGEEILNMVKQHAQQEIQKRNLQKNQNPKKKKFWEFWK